MKSSRQHGWTLKRLWLPLLVGAVILGVAKYHHAGTPVSAASQPQAQTTIESTAAWAKSVGYLAYADRPVDIQAIMQRMYNNDSRYSAFSALFVSHEPGVPAGSLRIAIQQPGLVRTDVFDNDTGTGTPREQIRGQGGQIQLYNPLAGVTTTIPRWAGEQQLPPLSTVPLTVEEAVYGGTTIHGNPGNATVSLADSFVHPASFITDPIFCDKQVSVVGRTTFAGRSAWKLRGDKVPSTPSLGRQGDGWQMWVDVQTGIILRLEYYAGGNMIGWAEMRGVTIDGVRPGGAGPTPLSLPVNVRNVSPLTYKRLLAQDSLKSELVATGSRMAHAALSSVRP